MCVCVCVVCARVCVCVFQSAHPVTSSVDREGASSHPNAVMDTRTVMMTAMRKHAVSKTHSRDVMGNIIPLTNIPSVSCVHLSLGCVERGLWECPGDKTCIHHNMICDGFPDCSQQEDEKNCCE